LLPRSLLVLLYIGIALAQYLCGLATVTSASRMTYAFARDGGLPASATLRSVSQLYGTPVYAIWASAIASVLFTIYIPMYETMAVTCAIFLHLSYLLPIGLGFLAYGRSWTRMGPWSLGGWYRPLAVVCAVGSGLLVVLGMQPPNGKAAWMVGGLALLLAVEWFAGIRNRFQGPPQIQESGLRSLETGIRQADS